MRDALLIHLPSWAWVLVPTWTTMLLLSSVLGCWVISGRLQIGGWTRRRALLVLIPGVFVCLPGAKLGYLLQYGPHLILARPLDSLLAPQGYSLLGGMVACSLFCFLCIHPTNLSLALFADAAAYGLMLVLCLQRLGCFLAGCNYGKLTNLPWGLCFPPHSPAFQQQLSLGLIPRDAEWSLPVHPTQLYESALGLGLFWFARDLWPRRKFNGQLYVVIGIIYMIARFFLEFVRGDAGGIAFGPLTFAQGFCLLLLVLLCLAHWNALHWKLLYSPPWFVKAAQKERGDSSQAASKVETTSTEGAG